MGASVAQQENPTMKTMSDKDYLLHLANNQRRGVSVHGGISVNKNGTLHDTRGQTIPEWARPKGGAA